MDICEEKLRFALKEFMGHMASRLAEKEAQGYKGWDGAYSRRKLWLEIKRDLKLIESGKGQSKHAVDICNRLFMIDYKSSPADFKMRRATKNKKRKPTLKRSAVR